MIRIKIIYFGKLKNSSLAELCEYYSKLANKYIKLELQEYKDIGSRKIKIEDLPKNDNAIILSEKGTEYTTLEFKSKLIKWIENFSEVTIIVGNAFGFEPEVLTKYQLLSLSKLTTAHELALVVFLEQIYRVMDLAKGGKYHK